MVVSVYIHLCHYVSEYVWTLFISIGGEALASLTFMRKLSSVRVGFPLRQMSLAWRRQDSSWNENLFWQICISDWLEYVSREFNFKKAQNKDQVKKSHENHFYSSEIFCHYFSFVTRRIFSIQYQLLDTKERNTYFLYSIFLLAFCSKDRESDIMQNLSIKYLEERGIKGVIWMIIS